ncbi:MAG: YicC family protein [Planctomycetia bacterium]|nr:YicC family protein [Planctomycetia bacterium]
MTGYGEAQGQHDGATAAIEVRTINSRYFKLSVKCLEGYSALEPEIEGVVRQQIRRGTIQVALRIDRPFAPEAYRLNKPLLASYRRQVEELLAEWNVRAPLPLESLLLLPGVASEQLTPKADVSADWPLVKRTLEAALENLARMRTDEGRAMADDLLINCQTISRELAEIDARAPLVVESYRARIGERLQKSLAEFQITLDPADLIKEVSLFAERSDISEEIVRLRSHLEQFDQLLAAPDSAGRKLEFLTQEMFREANTIGSKANDVPIARHTIEIKAAIERMREMIQNVE